MIERIGIVGTGTMGTGIAGCIARNGFSVDIVKGRLGPVEGARLAFEKAVRRESESGKLGPEEAERMLGRIVWSEAGFHGLDRCDLIIEAVVEDRHEKAGWLREIGRIAKPGAILASTTSSLAITALAEDSGRPEAFVGLHFFNPADRMKLVEVVLTCATDARCVLALRPFLKAIGKEAVELPDTPGFAVNRLLVALFVEAIRMLEGRKADAIIGIDACMRHGAAHPMGPFQLMDFIGLDVVLAMAMNLCKGLNDRGFAPPRLLRAMVTAGQLGRKSAAGGFYDYADRKDPKPSRKLRQLLGES